MPSTQDYLNLEEERTGLSIQDCCNLMCSTSGFTTQGSIKKLLDNSSYATPTGFNIGTVDMLNGLFTTNKYSFQDCAKKIYET